ncbi:MAG: AMP-binding protein [Acuticoccus sp.]
MKLDEFQIMPTDRQHAVAVISPDGEPVTYPALERHIAAWGACWRGDKALVAIEAPRTVETLAAYLAALRAGHAVAMLAPDDAQALADFCARYRPQFVVRQGELQAREPAAGDAPLHPELALVLSTSGSTGSGKFVRLSRANVLANARAIATYLAIEPDDRAALVLPLNYCYGLSVLQAHLAAGASVSLAHGSAREEGFAASLTRHGCTNLSGVPHTFRLLEGSGFLTDLPPLRFMTVAGGRLETPLAARFRKALEARGGRFFVMYGQTEATSRMAYVPPERLAGNEDRIGVAVPGGSLRVVDGAGHEVAEPDTVGELVYRGPNVMMGYATSRADLAAGPSLEELRTGDLGARGADGLFRVVGRLKRMSKISGLRISHDTLEAALEGEGIEVAVVGDDRHVLALYCGEASEEDVRGRLAAASRLPRLAVRAVRVAVLPRRPSGKIDYAVARSHLAAGEVEEGATDVRTLFAELFAPVPVRGDDTFVSLGGDSLRFVQLSLGLEQRIGDLPEGWERLTVRELERLDPTRPSCPAVGSDLLMRAIAILMVVVHHATHWPIPGGAAALYLLVGTGLARFHGDALAKGRIGRIFNVLPLVLIPYYLVLAGYALARGEVPWASVFLVGNFGFASPSEGAMLPFLYWFVEIYVQTLAVIGGVFLIPAVRRLAGAEPFAFALALIGVGVVLRFGVAEFWGMGGRQIFTIPWNFYLFGFGWAAVVAATLREKLVVLALAAIAMPLAAYYGGNWVGAWVKFMMQLGVVAVLLFLPRIALPRPAIVAGLAVAAAGYYIYLVHRIIPEAAPGFVAEGLSEPLFQIAAIIVGVASGLAVFELHKKVLRGLRSARVAAWRGRLRQLFARTGTRKVGQPGSVRPPAS